MPLTLEQRRAKAREYSRKYRAKKRTEAIAGSDSKSDAPDVPEGYPLVVKVKESIEAMKQLAPSDQALVQQALATARLIDRLEANGDLYHASRIVAAHNALTRILHELGGTPTVRQQHEFRSRRVPGKARVADGDEDETGKQAGNVSQFRRPEKRRRRQN